jgi:hypothetical protein
LTILLVPPGADPELASQLESVLEGLAAEAGMRLEIRGTLAQAKLTPQVKVVVALPPDAGLARLATATPGTKFLAVGVPGVQPATNLVLTSSQVERPDQQGFLAGYLASVVTPDWRVGVLSTGDNPSGKANRQGFLNGAVFYCGLCQPTYPPFVQYPVYAELPSGAGPADQQAAADSLIAQGVTTVYVAPGAGDASLLEYLVGKGVNLIGGQTPPESVKANWIATITSDPLEGVRRAWAALVLGQVPNSQSAPLSITNRNEALFSVGRQRLVEQTRDELASGLIDTAVDPLTGDKK